MAPLKTLDFIGFFDDVWAENSLLSLCWFTIVTLICQKISSCYKVPKNSEYFLNQLLFNILNISLLSM